MKGEQLDRVRSHASHIRAMLARAQETPYGMIYRALAGTNYDVVALCLMCPKHEAPVAQVTAAWNNLSGDSVSRLTGPTVTPEELAIFMGLANVESALSWVDQDITPPRLELYQAPELDGTAED